MFDDLDPKDFEDTTSAVVASCANLGSMAKRARLLADAGLLSVITNEAAGGLGLPIKFAVPIVEKAAAGLLGFPLIETMLLARALAAVDPDLAKQISEGELLVTVAWTGVAEDKVVADAPMVAEADRVLIFRADGSAVLTKTGVSAKPEAGASFDIDAPPNPGQRPPAGPMHWHGVPEQHPHPG